MAMLALRLARHGASVISAIVGMRAGHANALDAADRVRIFITVNRGLGKRQTT